MRLQWLRAFATPDTTVYTIQPGRGYEESAAILGDDFAGVLVRDGWPPYRRFRHALPQTCLAHLLRRCRPLISDQHDGAERRLQAPSRLSPRVRAPVADAGFQTVVVQSRAVAVRALRSAPRARRGPPRVHAGAMARFKRSYNVQLRGDGYPVPTSHTTGHPVRHPAVHEAPRRGRCLSTRLKGPHPATRLSAQPRACGSRPHSTMGHAR